jgi:hypothetical protein
VGGAIHPDELLSRLTAAQWAGWQAYAANFPLPLARGDLNAAMIRQNCGNWGKRVPALKDLIVHYGRPRRRRSSAEMKDIAKGWADSEAVRAAAAKKKV